MTDVRTCDKVGCTVTFDVDNNEGIIDSHLDTGAIEIKYYCCYEHKIQSEGGA